MPSEDDKPVIDAEYSRDSEEEIDPLATEVERFVLDLGEGTEKALRRLREEAGRLVKKGRHTRLRLKLRGRELTTLPLAVIVAAEAATLWWAGPLRLLLANVVGKALLEVEVIHDADAVVEAGRQSLLEGELDQALARFREALEMAPEHAGAHLNLGVALRLGGDRDGAKQHFQTAAEKDPDGPVGREARRHLESLEKAGR